MQTHTSLIPEWAFFLHHNTYFYASTHPFSITACPALSTSPVQLSWAEGGAAPSQREKQASALTPTGNSELLIRVMSVFGVWEEAGVQMTEIVGLCAKDL